jgi:hypothetical protein
LVPDPVPAVRFGERAVLAVGGAVTFDFERVGVGVVFGGQCRGGRVEGFQNLSDKDGQVPVLGDGAPPRG